MSDLIVQFLFTLNVRRQNSHICDINLTITINIVILPNLCLFVNISNFFSIFLNFYLLKREELLKLRQNIGMIFQGFELAEQRKVLKNICFPISISDNIPIRYGVSITKNFDRK